MPNSGTLRGFTQRRLSRQSETVEFLRGDGDFYPVSPWTTDSGTPAATTGSVGDYYVDTSVSDFGARRMYGPKAATTTLTVSNRQHTNNWAIITTSAAHGLESGQPVTITDVGANYNGSWVVATVDSTTVFRVKTTASATEASTASTGSVLVAWPKMRLFGNTVERYSALAHNAANTSLPTALTGWLYGPDTSGWSNAAVPKPFSISGTAGYVVFSTNKLTGSGPTGEAYALLGTGSGVISTISAEIYAPTEATGKAGVVMGSGGSQIGLEINVRNDNKLYVDRNFYAVTNLHTSTTTATQGTVYVTRMGGMAIVYSSDWAVDVRVPLGVAGGFWDSGVFMKNTTAGSVTTSSLRFGG